MNLKYNKEKRYYESDAVRYEISNNESTIIVKIKYLITPVGFNQIDDCYYFKYTALEMNYGTMKSRLIKCEKNTSMIEQLDLIQLDIKNNPWLITDFMGITNKL